MQLEILSLTAAPHYKLDFYQQTSLYSKIEMLNLPFKVWNP